MQNTWFQTRGYWVVNCNGRNKLKLKSKFNGYFHQMCLSWFRGELNPHNVSDIMSHVTDREAADATTRRGGGLAN